MLRWPRYAKDETRILSWSADNTLRLWDVATGQQIGPAMKHDGSVVGGVLIEDRDTSSASKHTTVSRSETRFALLQQQPWCRDGLRSSEHRPIEGARCSVRRPPDSVRMISKAPRDEKGLE
jgi:hypothetical protein